MIPIFEPDLGGSERAKLLECIDGGWVSSQGPFIAEFEAEFARTVGGASAVATSSCTTALHLALVALGLGPGDEVLCPDLVFIAPANMIRLTGATPILVDVEAGSWAIDPERAAERITPRSRAIIVVHPFGHAADMDPIMALAERHGLIIIEDVAEAPGGKYKGRPLGSFGAAGCYSFYANKIITTGEGGMVVIDDDRLDQRLRVLRDHGMSRERRYVHVAAGFNYRMTNMQAALGLAQLERFDDILARRAAQAEHYSRRMAETDALSWRPVSAFCAPVHWLATITLNDQALREPLLDHLKDQGIDARQMVFPIHMAEPYRADNDAAGFPVSRSVSLRSLHLPSSTTLSRAEVDRVCDTVLGWIAPHFA